MFGALFSFLGGSAFRMIWGELSSYLNKKQDHQHEQEVMKLQAELDQKAHERTLENMRLQNDLGIKMVEIQKDAAIQTAEAEAFANAMKDAFKPTGITWVDTWNGIIRPQFAQLALLLWFAKVVGQGFVMDNYDMELSSAVLGFFIADRALMRRNK